MLFKILRYRILNIEVGLRLDYTIAVVMEDLDILMRIQLMHPVFLDKVPMVK